MIDIGKSITSIDREEWERLSGCDFVEQSYDWYRVIEESRLRDMHYVFVREPRHLQAAAYCTPANEQVFHIPIPLVEVHSPLGLTPAFFSQSSHHTRQLIEGIKRVAHDVGAWGMYILYLTEEEIRECYLGDQESFITFPLHINTYIDLPFSDFDDYLDSLPASARRSVRKTLHRAEERWHIQTRATTNFVQWKYRVHELQKYVCDQYGSTRWLLPLSFYDALETHLKDRAELLLCMKDEILLACGISLNSPVISQHKFSGVHPDYRKYQAYFLLYYEGIRRAIERNQKRIYFGTSNYEFKKKIGCRRENRYGLILMNTALHNGVLKIFVTLRHLLTKPQHFREDTPTH
jgi:predicted N-acyltransferase